MSASPKSVSETEPGGMYEEVPRRSARHSKPSTRAAQFLEQPLPETAAADSSNHTSPPRRNPKRKASEVVKSTIKLPHDLLKEALSPLSQQDIEDWEGWNELESEPAFFNVILKDLGVENVKAEEMLLIDQDSLAMLPQPVHGLIFLYQYQPEHDEEEEDQPASNVWFANQTIPNACATVALLNIVMNANVKLGARLQDFKDSTKGLCTALRGHRLSTDPFIRTIHNSFTRRMNQLNGDLFLEQEATEAAQAQQKKRTSKKKSRPRSKKADPDYGFHFVAYVEVDKSVWELDGLKSRPHLIGRVPDDSKEWTKVAQPQIQSRMLQYEDTQLSFNLLALCQSPLLAKSRSIAEHLASLRYFMEHISENDGLKALVAAEPLVSDFDDEAALGEFGLTQRDILVAEVPQSLKDMLNNSHHDTKQSCAIFQQLVVEAKAAKGEYRAELTAMDEEQQRVEGRKKDYGAALHKWVQKLAEKGVLEDMIRSGQ